MSQNIGFLGHPAARKSRGSQPLHTSPPWPFHAPQHRGKMAQGLFSDVSRAQTTAQATSVCLLLPCQLRPLSTTRCPTPITHAVLSCPAVPIKWFISRSSGQAARFWAEKGGMGTALWNKGLVSKDTLHNLKCLSHKFWKLQSFIHSFIHLFIQEVFTEDLELS